MKYKVKKPVVLDVSRWQGQVDWTKVVPRPVLVVCKASEGTDYKDPNFVSNWNGLQALNIRRGAYHYFHPEWDANQEFANYQKAVTQAGGFLPSDLPPVLDIEGLEAADPEVRRAASTSIKTWLDLAQAFSGRTPVIYTSKYQWNFVTDSNGKTPAWSGNYPLWVAFFPDKPDKVKGPAKAVIPAGWNQWAIWHYVDEGQITGINAPVNLNILNAWFAKQLGQQPQLNQQPRLDQQPPPDQQPPLPVAHVYAGKVVAPRGVNVRVGPDIAAKVIGDLASGATVRGVSIKLVSPGEAWLEIKEPMTGWCAIVYNKTVLISVVAG